MSKPRSEKRPIHGWLNIDKPYGMSSASVVAKVKYITKAAKVGHAGTLDPLASGVLPIALGEATKTVQFMQDGIKHYDFVVFFGESRDTLDKEGHLTGTSPILPTKTQLDKICDTFLGDIEQVPPAYSAIKVDGKRAYALARDGKDVELQARTVHIASLHCTQQLDANQFRFTVCCGKGTYIRSLAHDIAHKAGTLGYVSELIRTSVLNFEKEDTISLEKLEEIVHKARSLDENYTSFEELHPVQVVLDDIPVLPLTLKDVEELSYGRALKKDVTPSSDDQLFQAIYDETLIAIVKQQPYGYDPVRGFNLR